jgi:hypothetical protein
MEEDNIVTGAVAEQEAPETVVEEEVALEVETPEEEPEAPEVDEEAA